MYYFLRHGADAITKSDSPVRKSILADFAKNRIGKTSPSDSPNSDGAIIGSLSKIDFGKNAKKNIIFS